jgi:3-(3-hydroxy-phenyl)propionate hydroxylase
MKKNFDCIVIGYGPVGALLSIFLSKLGLSVAVIDKNLDIYPLPRAIHFDDEVMRIFQMVNLSEQITKISRIGTKGMHFVDNEDNILMVRKGSDAIGDLGWQKSWYFHQPQLEELLRDSAEKEKNFVSFLGYETKKIIHDVDFVTVKSYRKSSKKELVLHCKYLVGCDGANSTTSDYIGKEIKDYGLKEKFLVLDLKVDNRYQNIKDLPDFTVQHCDKVRPVTRCYISKKRRRWEVKILPSDDQEKFLESKSIWKFLSKWIEKKNGMIERSQVYTFRSILKKKWFMNRIILAGDSAHLSPPFLGQGMCAGIRDVAVLAWRLKGYTTDKLSSEELINYQAERFPHVSAFIKLASEVGKIMSNPDLLKKSEKSQSMRLFDFPKPRLKKGFFYNCSLSGTLFPQFVESNRKSDDSLGYEFVFIALQEQKFNDVGIDNKILLKKTAEGSLRNWMVKSKIVALIVRPDKYIFGSTANEKNVKALVSHFYDLYRL